MYPSLSAETPVYDACGSNGMVVGLDPNGDGFLAVKVALDFLSAYTSSTTENINICGETDSWFAVVYTRTRRDCNVSTPWPISFPTTAHAVRMVFNATRR